MINYLHVIPPYRETPTEDRPIWSHLAWEKHRNNTLGYANITNDEWMPVGGQLESSIWDYVKWGPLAFIHH